MLRYSYLDATQLNVPEGTQQVPALIDELNRQAARGVRIVHVSGDLEGEFQMLLEWEQSDGG